MEYERIKQEEMETEMMKAACLLPEPLLLEVLDLEDELEEDKVFTESGSNIEFIEYDAMFLYAHQVLRIYPDDCHQIFKTLINSHVYFNEVQKAGKEAEEMDEEIDTFNIDGGMDELNI
jgi:hypothetical protein